MNLGADLLGEVRVRRETAAEVTRLASTLPLPENRERLLQGANLLLAEAVELEAWAFGLQRWLQGELTARRQCDCRQGACKAPD